MSDYSTVHSTFSVERTYEVPAARVFAAWSDPKARLQWEAIGENFTTTYTQNDFRVGGRDVSRFNFGKDDEYVADARYEDIVQDRRIVYAYTMSHNERRISASLTTISLMPISEGTHVVLTEQITILDGGDKVEYRQAGIASQLDQLGVFLASEKVG
ncbi:polyketide cyclase [Rhizobium sp. P32RR-XVIII]|uniref:SRPBCC family protein n=1 Tax=Rhizobium sp. P32RR-XVIII TaxID=2726738 RepID=UPI001456754B|nr:SRPBCC family protein [Rhizobium sp. P32RR-XVIII]NLS02597.1 polyketide cyclase [Rhizobium sp. P32RR-XVIII]